MPTFHMRCQPTQELIQLLGCVELPNPEISLESSVELTLIEQYIYARHVMLKCTPAYENVPFASHEDSNLNIMMCSGHSAPLLVLAPIGEPVGTGDHYNADGLYPVGFIEADNWVADGYSGCQVTLQLPCIPYMHHDDPNYAENQTFDTDESGNLFENEGNFEEIPNLVSKYLPVLKALAVYMIGRGACRKSIYPPYSKIEDLELYFSDVALSDDQGDS